MSVTGAALCGDQTAVSNACRSAQPDSFDEVLCDDRVLEKAQQFVTNIAQKAVELLLGAKMSRPR
jgi:hypothetical protein